MVFDPLVTETSGASTIGQFDQAHVDSNFPKPTYTQLSTQELAGNRGLAS